MSHKQLHILLAFAATLLQSCVLAPEGLEDERSRLAAEGRPFEHPLAERDLPELSMPADRAALLERAFLANGELEAAWFEWRAALERVAIAAGWPNTNLAPAFSYAIDGGGSVWDRTTVSVGFDAMMNLSLPVKVKKSGEIALAEARAAGRRFAALRFRLQREVLDAYLGLALDEEELRIARESLALARLSADTVGRAVEGGAAARDLFRAQVDSGLREDEVARVEARIRADRARLNGLLARAPDAELEIAADLPEPAALAADDAALIAAGVERNPRLEALAHEARGRADALELARLQYLPDINPFVVLTGGEASAIGAGVPLPTTLPQLKAGVEAAQANLRAAEAIARQARSDEAARYVATLVALRDSERQARWFEERVLPAAEQALSSTRQSYATGSAGLVELIAAQDLLLDVRLTVVRARIARELRLAELEELAGVDLESIGVRNADVDVHTARAEGGSHE